jgi:hypothetical protein
MKTATRENPNLWVHAQEPSEWIGPIKTHPAHSTGLESKKIPAMGIIFLLTFPFYRTQLGKTTAAR